jgi:hypothetical protein
MRGYWDGGEISIACSNEESPSSELGSFLYFYLQLHSRSSAASIHDGSLVRDNNLSIRAVLPHSSYKLVLS